MLPQILPHILPQTTSTNHYHNGGSISTITPSFVPIRQLFNFTTHFYPIFCPKKIPQTTTTNNYNNLGGQCLPQHQCLYQSNNFSLKKLPNILPHMLPQTTTINHYHNRGFQYLLPYQFLIWSDHVSIWPHILQQTTTTNHYPILTHPATPPPPHRHHHHHHHHHILCTYDIHRQMFWGLQRFWGGCKDLATIVQEEEESGHLSAMTFRLNDTY